MYLMTKFVDKRRHKVELIRAFLETENNSIKQGGGTGTANIKSLKGNEDDIPQWGLGEEVRLIVSQQQNQLKGRKVKQGGRERKRGR